jgi:hypothetical protein
MMVDASRGRSGTVHWSLEQRSNGTTPPLGRRKAL